LNSTTTDPTATNTHTTEPQCEGQQKLADGAVDSAQRHDGSATDVARPRSSSRSKSRSRSRSFSPGPAEAAGPSNGSQRHRVRRTRRILRLNDGSTVQRCEVTELN
jgi:hypothetical protein